MNIAEKRQAVKALNLKEYGASVIAKMSEEELDDVIANNETSEEEEEEEEHVAIQTDDVFENEKGEKIPIVLAQFDRMTSNGAFVFKAGEVQIVTNDSDLRFLKAKGGLAQGDTVAFKPESISFNGSMQMHTGTPNKSASPRLMSVVNYRSENKQHNLAMRAELTAAGLTNQEAREIVAEKISADVLSTFQRPTFRIV